MDSEAVFRLGSQCLRNGEKLTAKGCYGRAFSNYLLALKLNPSWKNVVKDVFAYTLHKWSLQLEESKRYTDMFKCYEEALEIFPENAGINYNLGAFLFRCGSVQEAFHYFHNCLKVEPNHIEAATSLESAKNLLVERWHFRMLNCRARNKKFNLAIDEKIKSGCKTVLDIGTGTGILSLNCSESGAETVHACEMSPEMALIAEKVFQYNKKPIKLLKKHSSDLKVPEDLTEKVDMLVCEIFDSALLGEHVLETLVYAWENLLKDTAKIIPEIGTLLFKGVESLKVGRMWFFNNKIPGFDVPYTLGVSCDSYDTENCQRGGFRGLTEELAPLSVNFGDLQNIKAVLCGDKDSIAEFECLEDGLMHCFVCRFSLLLSRENVLYSGSNYSSCWDEAIFPIVPPIQVQKGDKVPVKFSFEKGKVSCKVNVSQKVDFNISQSCMRFLNNGTYTEALLKTAESLNERRGEQEWKILDTLEFPLIGLWLLKCDSKNKLNYVYSCDDDHHFVKRFAKDNDLLDQVEFVTEEDLILVDETFDVIVLNCVENSGVLQASSLSSLNSLRNLLKPNGILLPKKLSLQGQIVDSYDLLKLSRVLPENVDYDIAKFINMYKSLQHIDFKIDEINAVNKSKVLALMDLPLEEINEDSKIHRTYSLNLSSSNSALIYWFRIQLFEDIVIETNSSDSHKNLASFIFEEKQELKKIDIFYKSGHLLITAGN